MAETFTRRGLYDLVWSQPIRQFAKRFGLSDVAIAKTCRRAAVPVPPRGYWARKEAARSILRIPLPARGLGMSDEVIVAKGRQWWPKAMSNEELLGPLPAPPSFEEPIEAARDRARGLVGKVTVPRQLDRPHLQIAHLLAEDDRRREEQRQSSYPSSWNAPKFDTPLERRRLRILNGLFFALSRSGARPGIVVKDTWDVSCIVGDQYVGLILEPIAQPAGRGKRAGRGKADGGAEQARRLRFEVKYRTYRENPRASWQDDENGPLERRITEIAIEILVAGECQYREECESAHHWRVERKAELEKEIERRRLEAERKERERLRRIEKARIDRLLGAAAALRQADDIRAYVALVRAKVDAGEVTVAREATETWSAWALAQADRIDPVRTGAFLTKHSDDPSDRAAEQA